MKTHDYTKRTWGHDYCIIGVEKEGQKIRMSGWGLGIKNGDFILIQSQSKEPGANPDTRYKVAAVEYYNDPLDMWSMTATFAPRMQKVEA